MSFALDALDGYAHRADNPSRLVPNPAKARDQVSDACGQLVAAQHADVATAIDAAKLLPVGNAAGPARTSANIDLAASAELAFRCTPGPLPLSAVRPGSRLLLEPEHERLNHAVRISAYSSERRPGPAAVS